MRKISFSVLILAILFISSCSTPPKNYTSKEGAKLFTEQKHKEAIEVFEKVLEKDPNNKNAQYNIAVSYIQLEKYDKAIELLEYYLKLNTYSDEARHNLAFSYLKNGNYKKAVLQSFYSMKKGQALLIREEAYRKLEQSGFKNKSFAQFVNKSYTSEISGEKSDRYLFFKLSISKDGSVEKAVCKRNNKEISCGEHEKFLLSLDFIPAYDFFYNMLVESDAIGFFTTDKNKTLLENLILLNQLKVTSSEKEYRLGALDRSDIDNEIRRNLYSIRTCYARALDKDGSIYGRVVINFIIDDDGFVPVGKVLTSSMHRKDVEECVANQIKKIKFPAPKGGGIVIVNYPFVFKHSYG